MYEELEVPKYLGTYLKEMVRCVLCTLPVTLDLQQFILH